MSNRRLLLIFFGAVTFLIGITVLTRWADRKDCRAAVAALPARQLMAEVWLKANDVPGRVTCFTKGYLCDVVPAGAKAPFKIRCRVDADACELE